MVVADLMTQVLSDTRYRGRGLGRPAHIPSKQQFSSETHKNCVLILRKKNHVHVEEICKELNAMDCIKFPYYSNIITIESLWILIHFTESENG